MAGPVPSTSRSGGEVADGVASGLDDGEAAERGTEVVAEADEVGALGLWPAPALPLPGLADDGVGELVRRAGQRVLPAVPGSRAAQPLVQSPYRRFDRAIIRFYALPEIVEGEGGCRGDVGDGHGHQRTADRMGAI
jgi:hypothetical protein